MRRRHIFMWAATAFIAAILILAPSARVAQATTNGVVISALYPGGGNPGSTYKSDYIEIFNASDVAVNVNGWSVQYVEPVSAHWQKTFLPDVWLLPGQYLMARQKTGSFGTADVPADAEGVATMQGDGSFKVTIVRSKLTIHGHSPWEDASMEGKIEDFFGGGTANRWEGQAKAGTLEWTQAWFRQDGGCQDTDNNDADFYIDTAYPNARSMSSPLAPCNVIETELAANGGFEDGTNSWTLAGTAKVRCDDKGHGSNCALQLKARGKATQAGHMAGILAGTPSAAGDTVQISAFVRHNLSTKIAVAKLTVNYASATAGAGGNGWDKLKLKIDPTGSYAEFANSLLLADTIVDGKVVLKHSTSGKVFIDDLSITLLAIESRGPRALPPPVAPAGFRGNN